jgi:hypothetical protein
VGHRRARSAAPPKPVRHAPTAPTATAATPTNPVRHAPTATATTPTTVRHAPTAATTTTPTGAPLCTGRRGDAGQSYKQGCTGRQKNVSHYRLHDLTQLAHRK